MNIGMNNFPPALKADSKIFSDPGNVSFQVPDGVFKIAVTLRSGSGGGGGGGGSSSTGPAPSIVGGNGVLSLVRFVMAVVPGQVIPGTVGDGGVGGAGGNTAGSAGSAGTTGTATSFGGVTTGTGGAGAGGDGSDAFVTGRGRDGDVTQPTSVATENVMLTVVGDRILGARGGLTPAVSSAAGAAGDNGTDGSITIEW